LYSQKWGSMIPNQITSNVGIEMPRKMGKGLCQFGVDVVIQRLRILHPSPCLEIGGWLATPLSVINAQPTGSRISDRGASNPIAMERSQTYTDSNSDVSGVRIPSLTGADDQ